MSSKSNNNEMELGRIFMLCSIKDRIKREGYAEITQADINRSLSGLGKGSGQGEIRLLNEYSKKKRSVGSILSGLMIFPTSKTSWIIFKGDGYELDSNFDLGSLKFPPRKDLLMENNALWIDNLPLTTSGQLKSYVRNGEILNEIFNENSLIPSIEGKQGLRIRIPLEFNGIVKSIDSSTGIELDGSVEGKGVFIIEEYKSSFAEAKSVAVKQLFIPYIMMSKKFKEKQVNKDVFAAYICPSKNKKDNVLHVFVFKFGSDSPDSIKCVSKHDYRIYRPIKETNDLFKGKGE